MKRSALLLWALPLSLWLGGCASYTDQVKEMDSAFRMGDYTKALEVFEKSDIKEQDRNKLLYHLEKGSILDRLAEGKNSRTHWIKADKLVDELYTSSISKEAATYLYNEGVQAYAGEDYEKVAIHTMLAHSYLGESDLAEARVEAARINSKLNEINSFYKENKNKYKDDAYARYLSGLIYESLGEYDAAIIDYRASLKVYETEYTTVFGVTPPQDMIRALYRLFMMRDRRDEARLLAESHKSLDLAKTPLDTASIVVVHELGLINEKRASDFVYPIGGQVIRFSFPVIKKNNVVFRQTGVRINEGLFESGELAQNFNAIAYESLEDRRLRMILKSAARLLIKGQLTQKAEKEFGAVGWIAGNIYKTVTETADTRGWTTLPAAIYVTRVFIKPGVYNVAVSNNGRVSDIQKLHLKMNEVRILRDAAGGSARKSAANDSPSPEEVHKGL